MGLCQRIWVEGRSHQQESRVSEFQRDDSVTERWTVPQSAGSILSVQGIR